MNRRGFFGWVACIGGSHDGQSLPVNGEDEITVPFRQVAPEGYWDRARESLDHQIKAETYVLDGNTWRFKEAS